MSAREPGRGPAEPRPVSDDGVSEGPRERMTEPSDPKRDSAERKRLRGPDPFVSFTEWSGPADEADYADL